MSEQRLKSQNKSTFFKSIWFQVLKNILNNEKETDMPLESCDSPYALCKVALDRYS